MLCGKYFLLCTLSSLFFFKSTTVNGFIDPITGSFVVGAFAAGYFAEKIRIIFGCPEISESKVKDLGRDMKKSFFGQHIASKIVVSALKGNLHRSKKNKKPLVMCFQGSSGTGKNFLSDLIAMHIFETIKEKELRYHPRYHIIQGQNDFPLQSEINNYKEKLYFDVKSAIKSCDTNLFIFDEIHFMHMGILDVLTPILENNDLSIDSRNSIFIFITNTGAESIIEKYLDLWVNGVSRENMTVEDFDTDLLKSAFNNGGLKKSSLIDSHVIDFYIPFLPLEKDHVIQCIEAELKDLGKHLDSERISEILRIVTYGPEPQNLFALSGCKRLKPWITTKLYPDEN